MISKEAQPVLELCLMFSSLLYCFLQVMFTLLLSFLYVFSNSNLVYLPFGSFDSEFR